MSGSTGVYSGFGSIAGLVQRFESGGDYTAQSATSSASGAYQFTRGTWSRFAPAAGVDLGQYPTAGEAPPAVQDAVFATTYSQVGLQPWTCPGCNPGLASYVASNRDAVNSLPVLGADGGAASSGTGAAGGVYDLTGESGAGGVLGSGTAAADAAAAAMGVLPPLWSGGPFQVGIAPGISAEVGSWITGAENAVGRAFRGAVGGLLVSVSNWFKRGSLIFIGAVLILGALFWLAAGSVLASKGKAA